MRLVVGLGNPGKEYESSRHNLGFQVLDRLAAQLGAPAWKKQHEALVARGTHQGQPYLLAKPQTYMNNSGRAVQALMHFYKVQREDCVIIVDDLDLPPGRIRQRTDGSDGGHRGLRSIEEALGGQDYKRMRIGIGRPEHEGGVVSHVLGGPDATEELAPAVEEAARLALAYLESGTFENWSTS